MPFTSLNKVVTLFLVGSLALGWVVVVWWAAFLNLLRQLEGAPGSAMAVASAVFIALAGAAGVVIDGLADIVVRKPLKWVARRRNAARLFWQTSLFDSMDSWRLWLESASQWHASGRPAAKDLPHPEARSFQLAAGLFQQHASQHHFEWVISHYSTYYLATSSSLVLALSCIIPIRWSLLGSLSVADAAWLLVAITVLLYASLSLAVDRYLYTYVASFRFAALWAEQHTPSTSSAGVVSEPAAP